MKTKLIESYVNKGCRTKLDLFFGDGSKIEISKIMELTQLSTTQCVVKVYFTDPKLSLDYWPENINWIMEEAWQFVHGKNSKVIVQATYDII